MNINLIIGIITIVITIIFGLFSLFINYKEKTIRYWHVETESVFSTKIKEIDKLQIEYKQNKIKDNIVMLTIIIENNGKKDIDKHIVHEPFKIDFKHPIKLLEFESVKLPLGTEVIMNENSLICIWDLFKKNEFIILKVLLHYDDSIKKITSSEIQKKYTEVSFRITDLNEPKKINHNYPVNAKPKFSGIFICIFVLIITTTLFFQSFSVNRYHIAYENSSFSEKEFTTRPINTTSLKIITKSQDKIIKLEDFNNSNIQTTLKILSNNKIGFTGYLFIIVFFMYGLLLCLGIITTRNKMKVRSFFKNL